MTLEKILFRKKTSITVFCFLPLVYLLPSFINERTHNTLLVVHEGAVKHILRNKWCLYGFENAFWKVLFDFLFVVCLLFFWNRKKNWIRQLLITFYWSIGNRKPKGYFSWFLTVLITLELIVLKKNKRIFQIFFILYCLIVTKPYYGLVPYIFWWIESYFVWFQFYLTLFWLCY